MLANAISKHIEGGGPENTVPKTTKYSYELQDIHTIDCIDIQEPLVLLSVDQHFCHLKSRDPGETT